MTKNINPTVLFAPLHPGPLLSMLPVADALSEKGYRPVFVFLRFAKFNKLHFDLVERRGFRWLSPENEPPVSNLSVRRCARASLVGLRIVLPSWARDFIDKVVKNLDLLDQAKFMLLSEKVKGVVLIGDRHIGLETALVKVANQLAIPSLIVPFALSNSRYVMQARLRNWENKYRASLGMDGRLNKILGWVFPKWVAEYDNTRLLIYDGSDSLAAWIVGIMPVRPWTLGGGAATLMAVENKVQFRIFEAEGIKPEKMVVTGHPQTDRTYESLRTMDKGGNVDNISVGENDRVVLCALPQFAEHKLMDWDQHWTEIEFIIETLLSIPKTHLILSLHPKCDLGRYEYLESKYPLALSTEGAQGHINQCDVFVAIHSTTVIQAIGSCVPTLVMGFYFPWIEAYDEAPGVMVVKNREEFTPTYSALLQDKALYAKLKYEQEMQTDEWIVLDGKCTERVAKLFVDLVSGSK